MNKTGIRKLEDKLEVKNALLIELLEYVRLRLVEDGKDTERIDDLSEQLKQQSEIQKQKNIESRNARKKYHHGYYEKNK